ncbi:MAG: Rieske (2Fe-2S) protein [Gemmatimonadota bacterium]|nr:Rieske (2Fe-2S) protein [Gemmatimonadota bacterium]
MREAAIVAAGVLVALGATSRVAMAMPLDLISGSKRARGGSMATVHYAIPTADGVQIDKDNEVILARWQNVVYAFNLSCPHQNTALRWDAADSRFQCPKHHSKYRPDGTYIEGRATRSMDRLAIHREGTSVVVDTDQLFKEDEDDAKWVVAKVIL